MRKIHPFKKTGLNAFSIIWCQQIVCSENFLLLLRYEDGKFAGCSCLCMINMRKKEDFGEKIKGR